MSDKEAAGMYALDNGTLSITVSENGAELQSLMMNGLDYLWNGDERYWAGRSPLLFPIVGVQKDGYYTHGGKKYEITPHGFAKLQVFKGDKAGPDELEMTLEDNDETRRAYPFSFTLKNRFSLEGCSLRVTHYVTNRSEGVMPFSIGEHVGLRVPLAPGEAYGDYRVRFDRKETAKRYFVADRMVAPEGEPYLTGEDTIPLTEDMFDSGPIIMKGLASESAVLENPNGAHSVRMDFPGYAFFTLWAAPRAPFICLEPWNGIGSGADDSPELSGKEGMLFLQSGQTFECGYRLTLK